MVTVAEPITETLLTSVTWKDSVKVPLTASVTVNGPMPVYGAVPPVAETMQENGLPEVGADWQLTATTNGCGATFTVAETVAIAPFASSTANVSVYVPLTESLIVNAPVPK